VLFAFVICLLCYGTLQLSVKLWQQILIVGAGAGITMFICGFLPIHKLKELLDKR
jgi:hypothetical protein